MSNKSIYLIAYYIGKPRDRKVRTQISGWMNTKGAVSYDEQVAISKTIKNRDLQCAKVILDLGRKKVVLNGWTETRDFDTLFGYFNENYPDQAGKTMEMVDPVYMDHKFAKKSETVIPEETNSTGSSLSST